MSDLNSNFRAIIFGMIVFIAIVAAAVFVMWEDANQSVEDEQLVSSETVPLSEELKEPVADIVEKLQQAQDDIQAITEVVAERNRADRDDLVARINELAADRDELARQLADVEAGHPILSRRADTSVPPMPAKVASFKDGTVFLAPSCGAGTKGAVYRKIPAGEARLGKGRSCLDLTDAKFTIGERWSGGKAFITQPVTKPIPNAIAPYYPRKDLQDARRRR